MLEQPPLSEKQVRAWRLVDRILRDNFSNYAVVADTIKIDGCNFTCWQYAGNLNAAIGMLRRYQTVLINQPKPEDEHAED